MADKRQIARLVAQDLTVEEISQQAGVSPSYVYNLQNDDKFKELVETIKSGLDSTSEIVRRWQGLDESYDVLEELAVGTMIDKLSTNPEMLSYKDAMKTAEFANRQKRKTNPALGTGISDESVTIVTLPDHLLEIKELPSTETNYNTKNQLISVGDRNVANMSTDGVKKLLESKVKLKLLEG